MAEEAGTRVERDSMGEVRVPEDAFYGASTERARQNFPISGLRLPRRFIRALAQIKGAAALVNAELDAKAKEFMPVVKTGRTHLQDATPIRLGQEFAGYTGQVQRGLDRVERTADELAELPLGGTAVGTGINAHPEFAQRVSSHLSRRAGVLVHETDNHFQAQATLDAVLSTAGALRTIAVSLWKIGNDLRWLASGPRAGFGEITLPEVQPGSSIMPGKVNPVIIESVTMVVAKVLGNDQTIAIAAQSGSIFELNLMMPVAAYALL